MRKLASFIPAVFLIGLSCASGGTQPKAVEAGEPLATVNEFVAALLNADLETLVSCFAEDATVFMPFPSSPQRISGKKAIREAFGSFLESVRASAKGPPFMVITPRDVEVQRFGELAVVTFHLGVLPEPASEKPANFSRRTFVLREVSGHWLIIHLHASNILVPPPAHRSE